MLKRAATVALSFALLAGACSADSGVAAEVRAPTPIADPSGDPAVPERPTASEDGPGATGDPADPESEAVPAPDTSTLMWGSCADFGIPSATLLGTSRWECSTLEVEMDPFGDGGIATLEPVTLALTRHPATGARRGTLVMNPGGPGGSGLDAAWALRSAMPAGILRAYDIVSWDPRGIGSSTPPIDCGDDPDTDSASFIAECASHTGDLAAYLSAPYSTEDLEAIRVALGEDRLDYLGYSYGTIVGATYAARFPDRVGRFVLDGATDPLVGGSDGPMGGGFPYYADDGSDAAVDRFIELCDQSAACPMGSDTAAALDDLRDTVGSLPTADFDDDPATVDRAVFDRVLQSELTYAGDWPLLATALGDARAGDASALAALAAEDPTTAPDGEDPPSERPGPSFEAANLVIYCADFGAQIEGAGFCDALPRNTHTIEPVEAVDVDRPILVIGTEYDPITPGVHATEFAAALGDAVHVIWEGVGHTAFPASSACIDRIVSDHLLDGPLPDDGTRCPFGEPGQTDAEIADDLFTHDRGIAGSWVGNVLERRGEDPVVATCIGLAIARTDDRTISHVILDVTSEAAQSALATAHTAC